MTKLLQGAPNGPGSVHFYDWPVLNDWEDMYVRVNLTQFKQIILQPDHPNKIVFL